MTVWGSEEAIDKAVQLVKTEMALLQEEKFPIAESLHGTLIGVGGQTVKKMEEMSGTRIAFQVCMYMCMYICMYVCMYTVCVCKVPSWHTHTHIHIYVYMQA